MIRGRNRLNRDERGAAVIEMALALPVLVTMIYGIFTLGQVFESNAGIEHALGEGARYATLCPTISVTGSTTVCTRPTDDQIKAKVNSKLFGTANGTFDPPVVDSTTAASGYLTITVTYHQAMQFAFFTGPTVTLTRSKRVYIASTS